MCTAAERTTDSSVCGASQAVMWEGEIVTSVPSVARRLSSVGASTMVVVIPACICQSAQKQRERACQDRFALARIKIEGAANAPRSAPRCAICAAKLTSMTMEEPDARIVGHEAHASPSSGADGYDVAPHEVGPVQRLAVGLAAAVDKPHVVAVEMEGVLPAVRIVHDDVYDGHVRRHERRRRGAIEPPSCRQAHVGVLITGA